MIDGPFSGFSPQFRSRTASHSERSLSVTTSLETNLQLADPVPPELLEDTTIARAAAHGDPPGRPRRLTEPQQNRLEQQPDEPPAEVGIDVPASTPSLLQQHLRNTFGVESIRPSCRRLLNGAGLTHQGPRRAAAGSEPEAREEFVDELTKRGGRWMPPRSVSIRPSNLSVSNRVRRGFRRIRDRQLRCPASVTGRVYSARSPRAVTDCSHESTSA
jgi:transposase